MENTQTFKKNVVSVHGHTMEYNGNQERRRLVSLHRQGQKKKKKTFDNSVMLKLGDNTDIRKHTRH